MPHTILYIEDETAIIELLKDVLDHPDIQLLTAFNADEGIAKAQELKPALMIIDVIMPVKSGWVVYDAIRADSELAKTPIIMLTGQLHRYRIMKEFQKSAIDAYITKPFDAGAVRQEVEKMLGLTLWGTPASLPTSDKQIKSPGEKRT